ncbi:4Fe-4S binding protein [Desulfuromonas acetoxidans]|uniref:4Fe-4S binding protein n=1 Tax=Desulfuromonas acetoxidans TaxID=891 RepID=UPI00292ED016|nr:4Fe-4S binding protein [Desulfuromonas acetoxidans]
MRFPSCLQNQALKNLSLILAPVHGLHSLFFQGKTMKINHVHLIYFSPTGTTRNVIDAIAAGMAAEKISRYDLTLSQTPQEQFLSEGIAVIGIPVYAGRVPVGCLDRLANFSANQIPTILVALYGNREFEDALVELQDITSEKGFNVIAAGAFIGEHSYATSSHPVAVGRPDANDLSLAESFGQQIADKIERDCFDTPVIDGNHPYRARVAFGGIAPETDAEKCTLCGTCAEVCPVGIVTVADSVTTQAEPCIMCCACVKACKMGARSLNHPMIEGIREFLMKNCSTPKKPQIYL